MMENLPQLELWLQDIQSYLHKALSAPLEKTGFKFEKYNFSFTRKHGKNIQEFGFLFVSQLPINYRLNFVLQINNRQVKEAKSAFLHKIRRKDFTLASIMMFLKDFGEDGLDSEMKDYILFSYYDLYSSVESIEKVLEYEAIPLCDQLSNLNDLDDFYAARPGWAVNNFNLNNIISELIIARLNRKRDFFGLYRQTILAIQQNKKKIDDDMVNIIESCYEYLSKNTR